MRHLLIGLAILLSLLCHAQDGYYEPQDTAPREMTRKEQRQAEKRARLERKAARHQGCYCPYQQSTTVWHDIWNSGVVGTGKAIYQSAIKPQALGEVVGAMQQAGKETPLPSVVVGTAGAMTISQVQKARRHQRNRQAPQAGQACNCDPCPYHGQRY